MAGVNRAEPRAVRSSLRGWPSLVCLLGVLVGLLAMHGLAPGGAHAVGHERAGGMSAGAGAPAAGSDTQPAGSDMPSASVAAHAFDTETLSGCSEDGHCGGHARHADATCAAAKVSGTPVPAGPVPDPVAVAVPDEIVRCRVGADSEAARAPPSLAELQLLRI
ncbi:hypothetical protein IAG44_28365 [Streptomyces roseirectus]|uniref:Uncharacterized protein n=1 Tax=Streptomyces roseirectus TaxID=2768066 RepID=A0A7H0IJJ4_9ACTN|nr:DUF6153 family protein [Streptomyces roseirectus]QNP72960.1 hypothetical protein IAG44_28365 [Streptomyces roseirectus]